MGRVCMGRLGNGPSLQWAEFSMGRGVQLPGLQLLDGKNGSSCSSGSDPLSVLLCFSNSPPFGLYRGVAHAGRKALRTNKVPVFSGTRPVSISGRDRFRISAVA